MPYSTGSLRLLSRFLTAREVKNTLSVGPLPFCNALVSQGSEPMHTRAGTYSWLDLYETLIAEDISIGQTQFSYGSMKMTGIGYIQQTAELTDKEFEELTLGGSTEVCYIEEEELDGQELLEIEG